MIFIPDFASLFTRDQFLAIRAELEGSGKIPVKVYVRPYDLFSSRTMSQSVGEIYRKKLDAVLSEKSVDLTLLFPFRDEKEYWSSSGARSFTLGFMGGSLKDPDRVRYLLSAIAKRTSRDHGAVLFHACRVEVESMNQSMALDPKVFKETLAVWDFYRSGLNG